MGCVPAWLGGSKGIFLMLTDAGVVCLAVGKRGMEVGEVGVCEQGKWS